MLMTTKVRMLNECLILTRISENGVPGGFQALKCLSIAGDFERHPDTSVDLKSPR